MKKPVCLLMILAVMLASVLPALADTESMERVVDQAALLSPDTEAALTEIIGEIARQHQLDVVILNVNGIGEHDPFDYSVDYYECNGYGYGDGHDGIMLMIVPSIRIYYIMLTGSGNELFPEEEMAKIKNEILPPLRESDYEGAEIAFVKAVELRLSTAAAAERGTAEQQGATLLSSFGPVGVVSEKVLSMLLNLGGAD